MNDFGLLVGAYFSTLPTLASAERSELQLDASGRLILSGRFIADDSFTAATDAGLSMFAVRHDADTTIASADGKYAPLQLDATGRLKVSADLTMTANFEKNEDAASASGDTGAFVLATRRDSRPANAGTSADGDYASFFVNNVGELWVKDADSLAELVLIKGDTASIVTNTGSIDSTLTSLKKLEDAAASSGDAGIQVLAVRQDTLASSTSADGDYASFKVDAKGELYVKDADTLAELVLIKGDTAAIASSVASIDSEIAALSKVEDAAFSTGDKGIQALAVRHDAESGMVSANGDYAPLQVSSAGRLKVDSLTSINLPGSMSFNATDDLVAAADGLITSVSGTYTTLVSKAIGVGQIGYIYGYQADMDVNGDIRLISDDGTDIKTYKVRLNSSAMPGVSEHFSEGGRIEIAGSATMTVKIQGRKRGTGGNGNGSASIHMRIV